MAIDLTSTLSPYEYQNMLPLDVLAAVASETLRNEIISNDAPEIKNVNSIKRQVKKSVTNVMTFEDIKTMPLKSLVDKFSEMTSDELTKKYSYKCLLLPQQCSMTFKSFGNEKKACDKIKSHLLSHVQQLATEYESNNGTVSTLFIPRSPNTSTKHAEKFPKKSFKKQQISFVLPRANSLKVPKKSKGSAFCMKKVKKKFHNMNRKRVAEKMKDVMKCFNKDKGKMFNSVYLKEKPNLNCFNDSNFESDIETDDTPEVYEDDDKCERECYNSYSEHLQYAFLSDAIVKEEISESPSDSEQISDSSSEDKFLTETNPSDIVTCSTNGSLSFLEHHNYAVSDETKSDKIMSQEYKSPPRRYVAPIIQKPVTLPQLIIRTPPFPYVYTPLLPEIAGIEEIGFEGDNLKRSECSNCVHCMLSENNIKREIQEVQNEDIASDQEEKYTASVFYKMNSANSSVLECVENIVNTKHSGSCVPKNEISASENDENLENLQKVEKELALKYIAKLHGKGKKKIPDSLICQICPDKHFTAQATLIHHYRSHAGIKPYICKICSSKFTRQHSLNYHMLIHQNRSRFTCEVCGRTFRHPSHYKEHLRRHTGETPYHCTDCNLHFKTRNTFKRHLKTRHGKLLTANGIEDLIVE